MKRLTGMLYVDSDELTSRVNVARQTRIAQLFTATDTFTAE